jgi:hypothetical protein
VCFGLILYDLASMALFALTARHVSLSFPRVYGSGLIMPKYRKKQWICRIETRPQKTAQKIIHPGQVDGQLKQYIGEALRARQMDHE